MVANVSRPKGKLFNHMPGDENNALTGIHKIRSSEAQDIADKADFDLAQAMIMQISKINIPVKIGGQ